MGGIVDEVFGGGVEGFAGGYGFVAAGDKVARVGVEVFEDEAPAEEQDAANEEYPEAAPLGFYGCV